MSKKKLLEVTPDAEVPHDPSKDVTAYTMLPTQPGSGLFIVVKLTINDGEVINVEELSQPEYKPFAYLQLKKHIAKDWSS